jgi:phosphoglycolate phosphatase-like HAD superfamily hydrolase
MTEYLSKYLPEILALDFDGVICNGLREYFEIAWRVYLQVWQGQGVKENWRQAFYNLRPVVETGWEMPLVLRALELGFSEASILADWGTIAAQIVATENIDPKLIAKLVDSLRDQWIATDVKDWLGYHEFYPGVIDVIQGTQAQGIEVLIISTKEGRFIQELLEQAGVNLSRQAIFGKEYKRPKAEILQELLESRSSNISNTTSNTTSSNLSSNAPINIWFVEDRLKTLEQIAKIPALESVKLFLADWGYNTQAMRDQVVNFAGDRSLENPPENLLENSLDNLSDNLPDHDSNCSPNNSPNNYPIKLISLEKFGQDLGAWL